MGAGAANELDAFTNTVIRAWNLMGGEIKWEALPAIAEVFGIDDVELLIRSLAQIRDHLRTVAEAQSKLKKD